LLEMGGETDPRGDILFKGWQRTASGGKIRRTFRVKFQEISVRVEVRGIECHPIYRTYPWLRVTSCYYSQIVDCEDGRLRVGTLFFGEQRVPQPA
jgi:hypothetical protein